MHKAFTILILSLACGTALAGCGSSGRTRKLKSMAVRYVREKYDFKARAGRVSNDGISWLTPIWEKSKAGIVEMTYGGRTFYVHADIDLGADGCTDNYMEEEFCSRIASDFEGIPCEDKEITVTYTEGHYKHLVGKDVRTFEDLVTDEKIPGIFVNIYTYGADPDYIRSMDMSDKPWVTTAYIHDWIDPSYVHSEYKPISSPYEDELIHKFYAEYCADPVRFPSRFDRYEEGRFALKFYKQLQQGDLRVTCENTASLDLSEYEGDPASDKQGITKWYRITNKGPAAEGMIVFPGELLDHDTQLGYIERFDGEKTACNLMGYNDLNDFGIKCYFTSYVLQEGETMILRLTAESK